MHVQNKLYFLYISGYHLKKLAILLVTKADLKHEGADMLFSVLH